MRLKASILNSDATVNSFRVIPSLKLERGETCDLVVRLEDADKGIRYIPDALATVEVQIPRTVSVLAEGATNTRSYTDESIVRQAAQAFVGDRSVWRIPLLESDTTKMVSGSIRIIVTESTGKKITVVNQAITVLSAGE